MRIFRILKCLIPATLLITSGCTLLSPSIQSKAVRELIAVEGEKIEAAHRTAKTFQGETKSRQDAVKKALDDLNEASQRLEAMESVHAFVFSANQNVLTKRGVDAHAVAYLIGKIYLEEHSGLEKTVIAQFEEDLEALATVADRIEQSWGSLETLHAQVAGYSKRSAVAAVDPELLAAIIREVPGGTEEVEDVLKRSRQVNEALEKALGSGFLREGKLEQLRSITSDLVDLLERVQ